MNDRELEHIRRDHPEFKLWRPDVAILQHRRDHKDEPEIHDHTHEFDRIEPNVHEAREPS